MGAVLLHIELFRTLRRINQILPTRISPPMNATDTGTGSSRHGPIRKNVINRIRCILGRHRPRPR